MESRRWLLALAMSATLGAGACRVTVAVANFVESAVLVARTVAVGESGMVAGAV